MKYRKIMLSILIGITLIVLAACGSQQDGDAEANETEQTESAAAKNTEETDDAVGEAVGTENETQETEKFGYLKDINVDDYVILGDYIGLEIKLDELVVTDQDVDDYIAYLLQSDAVYLEVTDRAVQEGDTVTIDFVGKLDGVAFEGGTGSTSSLIIGSGMFIPGFEEGVIGMEIGDTKDVEAVFPDPYDNDPNLSGKTAVFTVTLNGIRKAQPAELTDEYVTNLGIEGITDVESFKTYLHDGMLALQQADYELERSNLVLEAAFANTEFTGTPEGVVNRLKSVVTSTVSSYAQMYGMSVADIVVASYGGTAEDYETTLYQQAETAAQQYVMMQAIALKEGIAVSDEEVNEALEQEAADYGYADLEEYKETVDMEAYREYLMTQKVIQFLSDNAVLIGAE